MFAQDLREHALFAAMFYFGRWLKQVFFVTMYLRLGLYRVHGRLQEDNIHCHNGYPRVQRHQGLQE